MYDMSLVCSSYCLLCLGDEWVAGINGCLYMSLQPGCEREMTSENITSKQLTGYTRTLYTTTNYMKQSELLLNIVLILEMARSLVLCFPCWQTWPGLVGHLYWRHLNTKSPTCSELPTFVQATSWRQLLQLWGGRFLNGLGIICWRSADAIHLASMFC